MAPAVSLIQNEVSVPKTYTPLLDEADSPPVGATGRLTLTKRQSEVACHSPMSAPKPHWMRSTLPPNAWAPSAVTSSPHSSVKESRVVAVVESDAKAHVLAAPPPVALTPPPRPAPTMVGMSLYWSGPVSDSVTSLPLRNGGGAGGGEAASPPGG